MMEQVKSIWRKSSNPFLLCFVSLVFALFCFIITKKRESKRLQNLPPSPPKLPIIGNLHQLSRLLHWSLRDLALKHGPIMLVHFGSTKVVVVSSADAVEEITKNHDVAFSNRFMPTAARCLTESGHDLVFSPYGDHWRQVKKLSLLHLLSQRAVRGFQSVREEEVSALLETLRLSSLRGSEIDLHDAFISVATNVVFRSFTGQRSQERFDGMNIKEFNEKLKNLLEAFCFEDLFPSLRWMDKLTGFTFRLKRTSKELDGFMDHLIGASDKQSCDGKSFVDVLLHLQEDGKIDYDLNLNDIKAIMQGLFVAAIDGVATLMEWVMAELVRHPETMRRAQEEAQRVVGMKSKISSYDIDQMHYLKCVIKETMRIHPSAVFPRETTKAVRIYGYEIPPNTKVMINLLAIHRDPKVWDNPDEFIPERFAGIETDFKGHQKGFAPFGFGRRYCPGVCYSIALTENVVANLLHWYNWELPGGSRAEELDMSDKFQINIPKKHPLRLVPVPRF